MPRPVWNFIYAACVVVELVAVGVLALNAAVDEINVAKLPDFLQGASNLFLNLQEMTGLVSLGAAAALIAAEIVKKWIGPKWIWEAVDATVNELRDQIFNEKKTNGSPSHHHRVTLFQYRPWLWRRLFCSFWKRMSWLVVVSRSGRSTQGARVIWTVSKHNPENCQGFAGKAWLFSDIIDQRIDYDVRIDDAATVRRYSADTFVTDEWVLERLRNNKDLPRRFAAVVLEVGGEPWGVVVIDSLQHDSLKQLYKQDLDRSVNSLKHLLQGV